MKPPVGVRKLNVDATKGSEKWGLGVVIRYDRRSYHKSGIKIEGGNFHIRQGVTSLDT